MPGGHFQFQLWYVDLMPLPIFMTGLPVPLIYKLFSFMYPINLFEPLFQHCFAILLTIYLGLTYNFRQNYGFGDLLTCKGFKQKNVVKQD
jgi:hypothetical protein